MAAHPKKVDFAQGSPETTPRRDRQSVGGPEAARNTAGLWRVVSRDGLVCEAELTPQTQAFRGDPMLERYDAAILHPDGVPIDHLPDARTSLLDLASEDAVANSLQEPARSSPACAKPNVGMPRAEAAPRLSGNLESRGEAGRASPPKYVVEPSRTSAPVALRPGTLDTDLCRLIHLWLTLPQRVREAVLALIDAATPS